MELSKKAKADLRKILIKEFGEERASDFSDEELNNVGELLLAILSEGLKMKVTKVETPKKA